MSHLQVIMTLKKLLVKFLMNKHFQTGSYIIWKDFELAD